MNNSGVSILKQDNPHGSPNGIGERRRLDAVSFSSRNNTEREMHFQIRNVLSHLL